MKITENFLEGLGMMFYIVDPSKYYFDNIDNVPKIVEEGIPYFFLFMIMEAIYFFLIGRKSYYFKDTIMSVSLGIAQQIFGVWIKFLVVIPYGYLYNNYRLFQIPVSGYATFIGCMLGCDCCYYWYHRVAHEWHVLWTGHSVHHSGQHYNFATALRQGILQPASSWILYLPLAIIGFHPALFLAHNQLNTLYQYWIHTELFGKLSFLEFFLNTPSHHRLHHRPPGNCNYAGVLIIWDRMFGTFHVEDEQQSWYGLAKPLNSFDPIFANKSHWMRMSNIKANKHKDASTVPQLIWKWIDICSTRRVNHPMVFNPFVLFGAQDFALSNAQGENISVTPCWQLPPIAKEIRYEATTPIDHSTPVPTFTVYAGKKQPFLVNIYVFFHFLLNLMLGLMFLDVASKEETGFFVKFHATIFLFVSLALVGRVSDGKSYMLELCRIIVLSWLVITSNLGTANPVRGIVPDSYRWGVAAFLIILWVVCIDSNFHYQAEDEDEMKVCSPNGEDDHIAECNDAEKLSETTPDAATPRGAKNSPKSAVTPTRSSGSSRSRSRSRSGESPVASPRIKGRDRQKAPGRASSRSRKRSATPTKSA